MGNNIEILPLKSCVSATYNKTTLSCKIIEKVHSYESSFNQCQLSHLGSNHGYIIRSKCSNCYISDVSVSNFFVNMLPQRDKPTTNTPAVVSICHFSDCFLGNVELEIKSIMFHMLIEKTLFYNCTFENMDIMDVFFDTCAFLDCTFDKCSFSHETAFDDCSFSGCNFVNCNYLSNSTAGGSPLFTNSTFSPRTVLGVMKTLFPDDRTDTKMYLSKKYYVNCIWGNTWNIGYYMDNSTTSNGGFFHIAEPYKRKDRPPLSKLFGFSTKQYTDAEITNSIVRNNFKKPFLYMSEGL